MGGGHLGYERGVHGENGRRGIQRRFGVLSFFGSVAMGALYSRSLVALVVFGLTFQVAAAAVFIFLNKPLRQASAA